MKLSVMQENLARGLSVVSRAVSNRSTLPVLANVLLKTEDAGLKLTATNLEIGITYWVPGKIETDGATTVPAKLLTDLVNSLPAGERVDLELRAGDTLHIRARPVRDPRQGHRCRRVPGDPDRRRAADDPDRPERPAPGPGRDGVRGRQRRGPADPDRRPGPVRGRPADPGRRRQLPDRGQDHPDPRRRSRRRASSSRPARSTSSPGSWPTPTTRSRSSSPGGRNQVLFHLDGHRPRQPAHRRPVPELPAGPAEEPHDPGRPRSRGAAAGGPAGGAHRPRVGQHRQAPGRRRRRGRDHGQRQRRGRRPRRPGRGRGRGRRDDDRVQRPLPRRRPDQRRRRAVRARAQRAALARRLQADRRRPATSTSSCPSGPPPSRRPEAGPRPRPDRDDPARSISLLDLRGYAPLEAALRARAAARLGPERGRQDEPARGDRPARAGAARTGRPPTPS